MSTASCSSVFKGVMFPIATFPMLARNVAGAVVARTVTMVGGDV